MLLNIHSWSILTLKNLLIKRKEGYNSEALENFSQLWSLKKTLNHDKNKYTMGHHSTQKKKFLQGVVPSTP